jgi:hypothetical protein
MAIQSWVGLSILHGRLEVACHAKSWSAPQISVNVLDQTALCHSWVVNGAGLKNYTWNAELMQDFAANSLDARAWADLGTAVPTTLLGAGTTAGSVAWLLSSLSLGYTPHNATMGDTAMASLSGSGSGGAARGLLMHDTGTARTTSGTGTAYQLGAVSASQRLYGALHVTAASGTTPSLVVKLQSASTSGGSYTDRLTFTTASATTEQWSSALGAITDTWWRTTWTVSGTSPSFTFGVSAGIS